MTASPIARSIPKGEPAVLVTGGAGFIGAQLTRRLLESNVHVCVVDNFITGRKSNIVPLIEHPKFHFLEADITDPDFLLHFAHQPLTNIYHCACPTGVPNIPRLAEEMLRTCSQGTFHVMELARKYDASVVLASSCEVYGQPEFSPQEEHYGGNVDPVGPRSPYEEGKRFAESVVAMYVRKYGAKGKIARFFNVYGPGMSPQDSRVVPRFLQSIQQRQKITIYGDGTQTRTFLYVDDLIDGLLLIMDRGRPGEPYNIGTTAPVSIIDLAELVIELTAQRSEIEFLPHIMPDHEHRQPSIKKISGLGWQPTITLKDGLKKMIATVIV